MRTTTLTAAGLLGLALLSPACPATAAGETCRGEAATIVGTGPAVVGTEGRDVIVVGTSGAVSALGGDDLICVSWGVSSSNLQVIDAGPGNDTVDTTAVSTGWSGRTTLGPGADTFAGGAAQDIVHAGYAPDPRDHTVQPWDDIDADRIDTGSGDDAVFTGSAGTANHDVVALGDGADSLDIQSAELAPGAMMAGGEGDDPLRFGTGTGHVTFDQTLGTLTTAAGTASVGGFEKVTVDAGPGKLTYRGSPRNDSLTVNADEVPSLDIATAAGQDSIVVEPATITPGSRIDGGIGRNGLLLANRSGSIDLDLTQGTLLIDGQRSTVANLQDATFYAPDVTMVGDARGNNLLFSGCEARLLGGDGRDRLLNVYDNDFESYVFDCRARTAMSGGAGADRLRGGQGRDRLFGDQGNDTIEGRGGNDRVRGGAGQDALDGGEGGDDVRGGGGRDTLVGRPGRDTLIGQGGRDSADGSEGRDRCVAERERRCEG